MPNQRNDYMNMPNLNNMRRGNNNFSNNNFNPQNQNPNHMYPLPNVPQDQVPGFMPKNLSGNISLLNNAAFNSVNSNKYDHTKTIPQSEKTSDSSELSSQDNGFCAKTFEGDKGKAKLSINNLINDSVLIF
jgi:hypothetical protein